MGGRSEEASKGEGGRSGSGAVETPELAPIHLEAAVRTFLTCATYQAESQFYRQGRPSRFVPTDEVLGVTVTVLCHERAYEVGLFGTEETCLEFSKLLTRLDGLDYGGCADALGEQMNLVAGRLAQGMVFENRGHAIQLGLPNTYHYEQCLTYRTKVIPLFGQQIGCDELDGCVWLTASERSPHTLLGEALALLARGANRMSLSRAVALLDEFCELDERDNSEELALMEHCKACFVTGINEGPRDLSEPLRILEKLRQGRAPLGLSGLVPRSTAETKVIEVSGVNGALVLEFMAEAREVVDSVDGTLMLAESRGVTSEDLDLLFRLFHNLKGAAGMVQVTSVVDVAHGTETLLSDIRGGSQSFDALRVSFVLASSALIRRQVDLTQEALANKGIMRNAPGLTEHCRRLGELHEGNLVDCINVDQWLGNAPANETSRALGETVRVDVETVSRVVDLIRGLTLVKSQFRENSGDAMENLTRVQDRLLQLSHEMSLVSSKTMFHKTSRLVRDLSKSLGKMVRVQFDGADYRVSRPILNALSDPLIHVIRNCIDHGIETPEERRGTDKPALATVSVKLRQDSETLVLEVGDDGRGIDAKRVKAVGVQRGLISQEETLDWKQTCDLLLRPGFSTAATVSSVSGRGVGLDVVRETLVRLGGELKLHSEWGQGCTFTLSVPLARFEAKSSEFSDSLEVLLMEETDQHEAEMVSGEVGWFGT